MELVPYERVFSELPGLLVPTIMEGYNIHPSQRTQKHGAMVKAKLRFQQSPNLFRWWEVLGVMCWKLHGWELCLGQCFPTLL
jgi:hypothetical protein